MASIAANGFSTTGWVGPRSPIRRAARRAFSSSAEGGRVVGFYALAAGATASSEAPGRLRRNIPDPIPVFVLGRLAVDRAEQGRLHAALLCDAALRTRAAAEFGGVAGPLAHALPEEAKRFYARHGFLECPSSPLALVARLKDLTK